jgi:tRNA threonylcarbamoyladenosine biosynthesis protein TsaE
MKYISQNRLDTINFAKRFAQKKLRGGETIALYGDLGAGKTTLSQGFALGLGIARNITSPTFAIMKIYNTPGSSGIKKMCHVDAYRLHSADQLKEIGVCDYLGNIETVTIIEWPDKAAEMIPRENLVVLKITILPDDKRSIERL